MTIVIDVGPALAAVLFLALGAFVASVHMGTPKKDKP